jgi:hypothetical protein
VTQDSHDRSADDRHEHGNHDEGLGKSVTFDQFDTTTFVHTDIAADDSFAARFILRVDGFELNHSPVILPGFGTHYEIFSDRCDGDRGVPGISSRLPSF